MDQPELFHEDVFSALDDCVRALGGAKKVGHALRPEKTVEDARRWLLDCMNPARAEKLGIEQALFIMGEARKIGCHAGMTYIARACGYADPQPLEPEDERAALQRQFIEQSRAMERLFARMERVGLRAA